MWGGERLIGVSLCLFVNAVIRSCAASLMVSTGSMAGILQWAEKNFADPLMRIALVSGT